MWWIATLALAGPPEEELVPTPLVPHMQAHFASASQAAWFVAVGDDDAAKRSAAELDHDAVLPDAWSKYAKRMRRAARRVERARDAEGTALRVAKLGQSCANCHSEVHGSNTPGARSFRQ